MSVLPKRVPPFSTAPLEEWHSKHTLPPNPTLDQKIKWHMEHARRCPCPSHGEDVLEELKARYLGKHQDFWISHSINDHRALGLWAAQCADRLLPYFEEKYAEDPRPRQAIETLLEWVETGQFNLSAIRGASLAAHKAAKEIPQNDRAAIFAAHAAGQAVATAHVPTHALGCVLYSIQLLAALNPQDVKTAVERERDGQNQLLPENLRPWVEAWIQKVQLLLPKYIRAQLQQQSTQLPSATH